MMEKERQQKVVGVALSITGSSQMDLASDIKNHLNSIGLFSADPPTPASALVHHRSLQVDSDQSEACLVIIQSVS